MSVYGTITMKELLEKLKIEPDVIYHADAETKGKDALPLKISSFSIDEEEGQIILTGFYGLDGEFIVDNPKEAEESIRKAQEKLLEMEARLREEWADRIVRDGYDVL
ncbi:protein of unknown function (plasmid) [Thermococcus nautili]|uniref:hypothetical protein n=1 Tax=Thermococcus nautili TaxID=195522 RepID=UPI002554567A|nr:hypothetical protein [Thermococcus nautili]CAI1494257.1 protein of unknown function [Thermococcus nautili]